MSVTKKSLSAALKKELNLSVETSDSLVNEFFYAIKLTLKSQKSLKLSGFGTFETFKTKERIGRNPKTMESFLVPARSKVRFSSTSKAKYFLN